MLEQKLIEKQFIDQRFSRSYVSRRRGDNPKLYKGKLLEKPWYVVKKTASLTQSHLTLETSISASTRSMGYKIEA